MIRIFLLSFGGVMIAFIAMGAALHFARYKRRGACCAHFAEPGREEKHRCDVCSCAPPLP